MKLVPLKGSPPMPTHSVCPSPVCASVNSRTFLVDSLGPMADTPRAAPFRPRACKHMTTLLRFCLSQRSTVWKHSESVTPQTLAPLVKLLIFSMHLKAIVVFAIFLI